MRGIYTALLQGDRAAANMLQRANSDFSTDRELENYRTQVPFVPAKITGNVQVVPGIKWKYEWREVRFTESTTSTANKTNGLWSVSHGFAYNWNELNNSVTFWAPLGGLANVPTGFALKPMSNGTPILLFPIRDTTGAMFWCFDKVNAIDGPCPTLLENPEEPGEPE